MCALYIPYQYFYKYNGYDYWKEGYFNYSERTFILRKFFNNDDRCYTPTEDILVSIVFYDIDDNYRSINAENMLTSGTLNYDI